MPWAQVNSPRRAFPSVFFNSNIDNLTLQNTHGIHNVHGISDIHLLYNTISAISRIYQAIHRKTGRLQHRSVRMLVFNQPAQIPSCHKTAGPQWQGQRKKAESQPCLCMRKPKFSGCAVWRDNARQNPGKQTSQTAWL